MALKLVRTYYVDKPTILYEQYYLDEDNRKQGEYNSFFEIGAIEKIVNYSNDKLHGEYKTYIWRNNRDYLINRKWYKDGKLHGEYKTYDLHSNVIDRKMYENGELAIIETKLAEIKRYYDKEEKQLKSHYFLDQYYLRQGEFKSYSTNGKLYHKFTYIDGRIQDDGIFYNLAEEPIE